MTAKLTYNEQAVLKVLHDHSKADGLLLHVRTGFPVSGCHRTAASLVRKGFATRETRSGIRIYRRTTDAERVGTVAEQ